MKKLNIVKIIDQWGWSFYFVNLEQQRHSYHNIISQKYNDINLNNIDLLSIPIQNILAGASKQLVLEAKKNNIQSIGGYVSSKIKWCEDVNIITTMTYKMFKYAKEIHKNKPVLFLPEAVDDNFFCKDKIEHDGFKVGFAGRLHDIKRPEILNALKYKIIKQCEWGTKFFIKRSLDPMKKFYNSIDVLILVSIKEGMPRVVMEAMACGIPVISTNVGALDMMIDKEWLVDVNPPEKVIEQVNKKLELLEKNPSLREEIGERNRKRIEKFLSWKIIAPIWDNIYDAIYSRNYSIAEDISTQTLERLKIIGNSL
jgi:glycosyltransferase involved in cell wall biosynthesis